MTETLKEVCLEWSQSSEYQTLCHAVTEEDEVTTRRSMVKLRRTVLNYAEEFWNDVLHIRPGMDQNMRKTVIKGADPEKRELCAQFIFMLDGYVKQHMPELYKLYQPAENFK